MLSVARTKPDAPSAPDYTVKEYNVVLTWNNPSIGATTATNGFETAFPGEGWSVKTTNTRDLH